VASVAYDPATRRALVTCENFTAPAGHDYELWAIRASGPESLGLVRADTGGRAQIRIPDAGDPATLGAFAVSLEARGGAPTPHAPAGPVVMVGKLGS
jgi:anti-sigma-K factor RskA